MSSLLSLFFFNNCWCAWATVLAKAGWSFLLSSASLRVLNGEKSGKLTSWLVVLPLVLALIAALSRWFSLVEMLVSFFSILFSNDRVNSYSSVPWLPASSSLHTRQKTTRNEVNQIAGRPAPCCPAPVETRFDSPLPRDRDEEEEDGITLSPTFSEVSCLTMPTCIGTFNGNSSQSPSQLDLFDNLHQNGTLFHETMSPIARHRQQKGNTTFLTGGAKISTHPYLQRLSSKFPTPSIEKPVNNVDVAVIPVETKTPKARGSPGVGSRREQLVSRVLASPRNLTSKSNIPKGRRQDWPARNANRSTSYPSKANRHEWQERNVITEIYVQSSNDQEKAKGKVAKSVEKVNGRRMTKGGIMSKQQQQQKIPYRGLGSNGDLQHEDTGDSFTTLDCIRVDWMTTIIDVAFFIRFIKCDWHMCVAYVTLICKVLSMIYFHWFSQPLVWKSTG